MLSYYVINYDKFRKVMQGTEKEALNCLYCIVILVKLKAFKPLITVMIDAL